MGYVIKPLSFYESRIEFKELIKYLVRVNKFRAFFKRIIEDIENSNFSFTKYTDELLESLIEQEQVQLQSNKFKEDMLSDRDTTLVVESPDVVSYYDDNMFMNVIETNDFRLKDTSLHFEAITLLYSDKEFDDELDNDVETSIDVETSTEVKVETKDVVEKVKESVEIHKEIKEPLVTFESKDISSVDIPECDEDDLFDDIEEDDDKYSEYYQEPITNKPIPTKPKVKPKDDDDFSFIVPKQI
jgi:hypothetical protein